MRRPRLGPQLAFALCVAAIAVSAPASLAAVQVAYRCDVDICLLDPDAPSTVTNLTDNGSTSLDETPVWSPDGKRIAFVSTFGGGARNIFVMTPDAPGQAINLATQVTHYPNTGSYVENPVWSPDGTRIAYEQEPNINGPFGIYVAAADGTTAQPLTITTNGAFPTWSPDGTKIAFSKGEQVYIANSDGSTTTPAPLETGAGHDPIWSPDGTRIAFDGINPQEHDPFVDLHVVSATGGGTPVITPINYTQWTFASWSADGTRLAYRSTSDLQDGRIRVVGADGSNDVGLGGVDQEDDRTPSWSPDGTRVVFVGNVYNPSDINFHDYDIYIASSAGGTGAPQKLTMTGDKNFEPMWRPDPSYGPPLPTPPGAPGTGPTTNPPPPVGGQQKANVVWITNRIPWSPGTSTVTVGKVNCPPDYSCRVAAAGIVPLHGIARAARKAKKVVVGRGHVTVPAGATRALKLRLTRAGIALLRKRRSLTVKVAVTTTITGRPKTTTRHTIRLKYVRAKHKRH